jgi:hypothetical protein
VHFVGILLKGRHSGQHRKPSMIVQKAKQPVGIWETRKYALKMGQRSVIEGF